MTRVLGGLLLGMLSVGMTVFSAADAAQPISAAPYPGTLSLRVDATDVNHRVLRVVEVIPTAPGRQTFFFPEWLPGTHSTAFSSVKRLAGLRFSSGDQALTWTRDTIDMGEFHVEVPADRSTVTVEFQYLTPSATEGDNSRISMSQDILALEWHSVLLYPAGYAVGRIPIEASVMLPEGWQFGTALEVSQSELGTVKFKSTDVEELVDSPLIAGRYFKKIDLDPGAAVPVTLDIAADRPEDLVATPEQIAAHRALVQQAMRLYGSHHYGHYDFLLTLSDTIGGIGLEHHQSSEDGVGPDYFTAWSEDWVDRDLLPHEYTHSWNGKFRRPQDLTTPNFNVPMQDSLLWMYEGQTQYWGEVLAARSGLVSNEEARENLAAVAAFYAQQPGRAWRNLQDTTNEEILSAHGRSEWESWQRNADYYSEMQLIWLDADTKIRELSKGTRSLDDFARTFLGIHDGSHAVVTYTFADLVKGLDSVQAYDWATFLRTRLDSHGPAAPLDGIARSGWRLVYNDTPNAFAAAAEKRDNSSNFNLSIGFRIDKENKVTDVQWNGPAYQAGLAPGDSVVAVNGRAFKSERLLDAVRAAQTDPNGTIELLVRDGELYRTIKVSYRGGLHYPHLERIASEPDMLSKIFAPRS